MTQPEHQPDHQLEPVAADPDALPRPEEEVAGVRDAALGEDAVAGADERPTGEPTDAPATQPVAGGADDSPPAQGEGASDSW